MVKVVVSTVVKRPVKLILLHNALNFTFRMNGQRLAIDTAPPPGPECDAVALRLQTADAALSQWLPKIPTLPLHYPRRDGTTGDAVLVAPRPGEEAAPCDVLLIFIHGGGFILGDHRKVAEIALLRYNGCSAAIVSIDYRLAPQHRFPTAAHDACDAVAHFAPQAAALCRTPAGAPAPRVVVYGESAGACLALVAALFSAGRHLLSGVILSSPALDISLPTPPGPEGSPWRRYGRGHFLQTGTLGVMFGAYAPSEAERAGPWASPGLAPAELLAGLPPVLVHACELDPLLDQAHTFATRAVAAGVRTRMVVAPGVPHAAPLSLCMVYPIVAVSLLRDAALWIRTLPPRA